MLHTLRRYYRQHQTIHRVFFVALVSVGLIAIIGIAGSNGTLSVLTPKGSIASQQRNLVVAATLLMLLIVVPVFALTAHIVWKYRAGNTKALYRPDWDRSPKLEILWWGFPTVIIAVLSVIIWQSSHSLDPGRPIAPSASTKQAITIQVVALQWKWLFIYPDQDIASVNYVQFPEDTPVEFVITADAPMNSFWIPQLGGQIYAMSGMTTKLHLIADEAGIYRGSSANLSGEGFAGMKFVVSASSQADFSEWVGQVKRSASYSALDMNTYSQLAQPSKDSLLASYASTEKNLLASIVSKYTPYGGHGSTHADRESR